MAILGAASGVSIYKTFIITTSQTFTVPYNCTASITAIGGGGAGGVGTYSNSSYVGLGAGGGAGGFAQSIINVASGAQFVCSIGAGGSSAGTNTSANGGNGGTTTASGPNLGSTLTSTGGGGGIGLKAPDSTARSAEGGAGGSGSNGNKFNSTGGAGGRVHECGLNSHPAEGGYAAGGGAVGIFGVTGTQGNGQANTIYGGSPSGAGCGGTYVPTQRGPGNPGGSTFGPVYPGGELTGNINQAAPINSGNFGSIFPPAGRGASLLFGGPGNGTGLFAGTNNIIGSTPPEPGGGGAGLWNASRINFRQGGMFAGGGAVAFGNYNNTAASAGNGGDCGGGGGGAAGCAPYATLTGSTGGIGAVIIEIMSPIF